MNSKKTSVPEKTVRDNQNQKLLLKALNPDFKQNAYLSRPPFWLMRQAGRYLPEYREVRKSAKNFLDFCYSPDLAVEVTLQPLRRFKPDAAILFSDILVIPDALGQKVEFIEGRGPVLDPVRSEDDLKILNCDGVIEHLSPVFETVSRLSRQLDNSTALIGFAGAPWTVAVYMVEGHGGTECGIARKWAYENPEGFSRLIDILIKSTSDYLIRQIEHGAEVIQLFDSWAGVLSETQFRQWVIEPNRKIVANIRKKYPHIPVIGFPRNAGHLYQDFVKQTGVNGVSLDHGVGIDWAVDNLQPFCTLQGNLDNHALLAGGAALHGELEKIMHGFTKGPFIFNLGHGVMQFTPVEHVEYVAEFVHNWNA